MGLGEAAAVVGDDAVVEADGLDGPAGGVARPVVEGAHEGLPNEIIVIIIIIIIIIITIIIIIVIMCTFDRWYPLLVVEGAHKGLPDELALTFSDDDDDDDDDDDKEEELVRQAFVCTL